MEWISRERVKVDRVAGLWLMNHFIDQQAVFVFAREDVSFDAILTEYRLGDPALRLLAEIVRAADSRSANPHPAGEGLRWIVHGLGSLGLSNQQILEREFAVYDALYAECRRRLAAPLRREEERGRHPFVSIPVLRRDF